MKTIEELSELMFNDEHIILLLGAGEVQSFLTRAVQHQFDDQATRYFFDKKNRELFKDNLMLSSSLYGDFGFETNLTKEQINAYKKRRDKLSKGSDLIYDSPIDPDIIELPRLHAKAWDTLFSLLLSEVGPSSPYYEQLLNNYLQYKEGSSSENYIRNAILGDIQDETLIMNFDYITTKMVNVLIFNILERFKLSEKKEDLFEGITVFELRDFTIFKNDEVKSMLEMDEQTNSKFENEADFQLKPKVNENKDDKLDGSGTYIYAGGQRYVGELKNGLPNGHGTTTSSLGDKYVGDFKDGRRHGHGMMTFVDGNKHIGEYVDDLPNGYGTIIYPNGNKYIGEFKNAKQNGLGIYTFANGDKYEGKFKDDEFHGQAKITRANGETFNCEYKNGEKVISEVTNKSNEE